MIISFSFVQEYALLTWRNVLWGYERKLIGWPFVVDMARAQLSTDSDNPRALELARLDKSEAMRVGELLRELAKQESVENEGDAEKIWLVVQLGWLFHNYHDSTEALEQVGSTYADFDYPAEIEEFVHYMPPTDGYDASQHSAEENNARLILKWKNYLQHESKSLNFKKPIA
jgi:hypothetical protein